MLLSEGDELLEFPIPSGIPRTPHETSGVKRLDLRRGESVSLALMALHGHPSAQRRIVPAVGRDVAVAILLPVCLQFSKHPVPAISRSLHTQDHAVARFVLPCVGLPNAPGGRGGIASHPSHSLCSGAPPAPVCPNRGAEAAAPSNSREAPGVPRRATALSPGGNPWAAERRALPRA